MSEIWRDITNYDNRYNGKYQISNLGNVRSLPRQVRNRNNSTKLLKGKLLKPAKGSNGYLGVTLCCEIYRNYPNIHVLVATAFIPNPYDKPEVNHIDGNKLNNSINNLEWSTEIENSNHAVKTGLQPSGGNTYNARGVIQLLDNNIIYRFTNIVEATNVTGINNISRACKYNIKAGGFNWKYERSKT